MPVRRQNSRYLYLAYGGLSLLFAIAVGVRTRATFDTIEILKTADKAKPAIDLDDPGAKIVDLSPKAQAAGIQIGDQLRQINGKPYSGMSDLYVPVWKMRAGDRMRLQVERSEAGGSKLIDADVPLPSLQETAFTTQGWIIPIMISILMPIFCVLLGFFVVAVRIRDPLAWILLFVLLGFSQQSATTIFTLFGHGDWFQPIAIAYHQSLANGWPIAMMLFGLYFPEPLVYDRRWPWAKWLWLVPMMLHLIANTVMRVVQANHVAWAVPINAVLEPADRPLFVIGLLGVCFFFFATRTKLSTTRNPDVRRRLKLLHFGAMVSLAPVFIIVLKDFFLNKPRFGSSPGWLLLLVLLPLFFFPVTLAYLILVERAMDVRVVVRQSLRYLLATNTVRVLQIVLIFAMLLPVALILIDPRNMTNQATRIEILAAGLVGVFLVQRISEQLRRWIDRRFFREAYNADLILSDLADKVRTIVDTPTLLETVAKRVAESLHVTRVALLLPQGAGFQPAYCLGYAEQPSGVVREDGPTAEQLRRESATRVYSDDEDSWIYRPAFPEEDRRTLQVLEAQLLLPLSLNQKLLGILSLGPKQSEAPYSKDDLRLLGSVATQTGFALENSRLTAAVASEVAQRERMNRELEIAREVQERLFPQHLPPFPGIEYTGSCRPALGVGGDYYDFIPVSATELGIAIGDVSGKGIPAALLMASLRASLRGQTIHRSDDLALLMGNVNTLVYESSTSNRYATFFYAQYDTVLRRLSYVNAGHNPPLIFRKGCEVIRLETGGPVVGLLPSFPYQQASIKLEAGDLFVAFTDGISEAMNSADEEWGEERLIDCAWQHLNTPSEETMRTIVAAADGFVAGAKQHDDMTIIVARIR